MDGSLDVEALHAGMPAVATKWVSQVWIRQSFREDGQPSYPADDSGRALVGPLHSGFYRGTQRTRRQKEPTEYMQDCLRGPLSDRPSFRTLSDRTMYMYSLRSARSLTVPCGSLPTAALLRGAQATASRATTFRRG